MNNAIDISQMRTMIRMGEETLASAILSSYKRRRRNNGSDEAHSRNERSRDAGDANRGCDANVMLLSVFSLFFFSFQPVGFVTFHTRAGAEAAKQDLQVIALFSQAFRETRQVRKKKEVMETHAQRESRG